MGKRTGVLGGEGGCVFGPSPITLGTHPGEPGDVCVIFHLCQPKGRRGLGCLCLWQCELYTQALLKAAPRLAVCVAG